MLKEGVEPRVPGPLTRVGGLYSDKLLAGAPEFLLPPLLTGPIGLINQGRFEEPYGLHARCYRHSPLSASRHFNASWRWSEGWGGTTQPQYKNSRRNGRFMLRRQSVQSLQLWHFRRTYSGILLHRHNMVYLCNGCRMSATKLFLHSPGTTWRATSRPHHLCTSSGVLFHNCCLMPAKWLFNYWHSNRHFTKVLIHLLVQSVDSGYSYKQWKCIEWKLQDLYIAQNEQKYADVFFCTCGQAVCSDMLESTRSSVRSENCSFAQSYSIVLPLWTFFPVNCAFEISVCYYYDHHNYRLQCCSSAVIWWALALSGFRPFWRINIVVLLLFRRLRKTGRDVADVTWNVRSFLVHHSLIRRYHPNRW